MKIGEIVRSGSDMKKQLRKCLLKQIKNDAPWRIIPSNNKKYARLETLRIIIECIEKELERDRYQRLFNEKVQAFLLALF